MGVLDFALLGQVAHSAYASYSLMSSLPRAFAFASHSAKSASNPITKQKLCVGSLYSALNNKKSLNQAIFLNSERVGFEPTVEFTPTQTFQVCTLNRSDISPLFNCNVWLGFASGSLFLGSAFETLKGFSRSAIRLRFTHFVQALPSHPVLRKIRLNFLIIT